MSALVATAGPTLPASAAAPQGEPPATSGYTTDSSWRLNRDGTTTRVFYPGRTFRSRNGHWAPIDATVRSTGDVAFPLAAEDALRPVLFGSSADALLRLRLDRGDVTVSAPGLDVSAPSLGNDGTVLYRDVARDTDLRYRVTSEGVREELVLRSARAPRSFRFVVTDPRGALGGLATDASGAARSALPVADGHRLELSAPFAYEQHRGAGAADPAAVTATYRTNGARTEIVKTLDRDWVAGRTWPIVVDPTMTFGGPSVTTDCHLRNGSSSTQSFCTAPTAEIGASGGEARRLLARFDLTGAHAAWRLQDAALTLTQDGAFSGTSTLVELRQPTRAWTSSATWTSYDGTSAWTTAGGDAGSTAYATATMPPVTGSTATWRSTAFTNLVKDWITGSAGNNGVLLKAVTETGTRLGSFAATEHTTTTSRPALTLTFSGAPDAPIGLVAQRTDGGASLSWTAPPSNGEAISTYRLRTLDATGTPIATTTLAANATTATVNGLTNGTTYGFDLVAVNAVGDSPVSVSNQVVPAGLPGVPGNVDATSGNTALSVMWDPPATNGSAILDHTVTAVRQSDSQVVATVTAAASATSAALTGLVNGVEYLVRVVARNDVGTGSAGEAGPVHPAHTPLAPPSATAKALPNGAHVTWTTADGNGGPVTGYRITTYRADGSTVDVANVAATKREHRRYGLTNGQDYDFDVAAVNSLGEGAATRTNDVTPDVAGKLNLAIDPGAVTTAAGSGTAGSTNGTGTAATLNQPRGVAYLGGYVYVSTVDSIRRIDTATDEVTTTAGGTYTGGCTNATTGTSVRIADAADMATDGTYLYFLACNSVRRVTPATGAMTTVYQFPSASGLRALTVAGGYAYVSAASTIVNKIDITTGVKTTAVTLTNGNIWGLAADDTYLYWEHNYSPFSNADRRIQRWKLDGTASPETIFEELATAGNNTPSTVGLGTLEIAGDYLYGRFGGSTAIHRYHKVTGARVVVAGTRGPGFADGTQYDAWFGIVTDIASDGSDLYVADEANGTGTGNRVRRVRQAPARPRGTPPASTTNVQLDPGVVSTVAGSGTAATVDGSGSAASFNTPRGVAYLGGYAYVGTDDAIQKVDPATGQVTKIAGGGAGSGCVNSSTGSSVRLVAVGDMTTDGQYVYFIACDAVRRLNPATGAVSTVTQYPSASNLKTLTAGPDGFLYLSTGSTTVRKIDAASGTRTTAVTVANGTIWGLAADDTYLYWEHNYQPYTPSDRRIQRWRLDGTASPETLYEELATDYSSGPSTVGLGTLELAGDYLYGRLSGTAAIRRYHKVTGATAVVAGTRGAGFADGSQFDAWFGRVSDIASDGADLFVADEPNGTGTGNRLRKVAQAPARPRGVPPTTTNTISLEPGIVTTIAGSGTAATTDGVGTAAAFNRPRGVAYLGGYAYVGTESAIQRVEMTTGTVATLVGSNGSTCVNSSNATTAKVVNVGDMTTDGQYVYFLACDAVRRLAPTTGAVSTVSSFQSASGLTALTAGPDGYLYVTTAREYVYRIDAASGTRSTVYTAANGKIYGIAADDTYLYWEHYYTSFDGTYSDRRIQRWRHDGTGSVETIFEELNRHITNSPPTVGLATLELAGRYLYGRLSKSAGLRRYDKVTGAASTVVGSTVAGFNDGAAELAAFGAITDVASDGKNILIADSPTTSGLYGNRLRVAITDPLFDTDAEYLGWDPFAGWFEDVNPGLGNFVTSATDASVRTIGPALELERTYNSADNRAGALGLGWSFEYDMTWSADRSGNISVVHPDGRREKYTKTGSTFTAPEGYHSTLTSDGSGGYNLTATDGTVHHFDSGRRLTSITDSNARTLTLAYTSGKLATVTSAPGRALHVTWTGNRISAIATDTVAAHGGALTWKYYYENQFLVAVCDPRDNALTGLCQRYEYDAWRMTRVEKPSGGTEVAVGYLPDGKVELRQDGLGNTTWFDSVNADTVDITDARGHTRRQDYDTKRRIVSETDPYGKVTTYGYDPDGHRNLVTDPNLNATSYTFDAKGNVTSTTNGAGETTWTTYDSASNVTATRDGRSSSSTDNTYKTTSTYDSHRNKLSETTPATTAFPSGVTSSWTYSAGTETAVGGGTVPPGLVLTATDGRNKTTTYSYDAKGDLRQTVEPSGLTTSYTYDELGRRTTQVVVSDSVPAGVTTTWTYDVLGKPLTQTDPAVTNPVSAVTHRLRTTNVYDDNGNLESTTLSDLTGGEAARTTTYDYDALDRLVDTTDAETGETVSRTYDAAGNPHSVTDQLGRRFETEHDKNNRPTSLTAIDVVDDPVGGSTPHNVVLRETTYDDAGRKVTETDARGNVRELDYDDADRVTDTTLADFTDRDATTRDILLERRTYDDAGQVTNLKTGGQKRHEVSVYDAAGRLTSVTLDPGGLDRVTTFTYDAAGNVLTRAVSQDGRTETMRYTYDDGGRTITETVENGMTDLVTEREYDQRGLLVATIDPRGALSGADPEDFTTTYEYDVLGRLVTVSLPEVSVEAVGGTAAAVRPTTTSGYDTFGNLTHEVDARGAVTVTTYDKVNRRTSVAYPSYTPPGGSPLTPTEAFSYDDVGNLVQRTDRRGNVFDYDYDSRNRLVRQRDPLLTGHTLRGTQRFLHDDAGSLVEAVDQRGAKTTFTYDDLDRMRTKVQRVRRAGLSDAVFTTTFDYDDLGNLTYRRTPEGAVTTAVVNAASEVVSATDPDSFVWETERDVAGRPVAAEDPLGRRSENVYDLAGRLTLERRRASSGTLLAEVERVYDVAGNLTATHSPAETITTFAYDAVNRLTQVVQPVDSSTSITTGYGYDAAGNLTRVTDGLGHVTTYTYTPWHQRQATVEPATTAHPDAADRTYTTLYDAGGLPVTEQQPGVTVTRTFDQLGRLTAESGSGTGITSASRTFGYDLVGLRTSASHPSGTQVFEYDDRGLLTASSGPAGDATYAYDDDGRLTRRVDPAGEHTFTWTDRDRLETAADPLTGLTQTFAYDDADQLDGATLPSGASRDLTYDGFGRIDTDTWRNSSNAVTYAIDYGYDTDGNVETQAVTAAGNGAAGTHSYEYDLAGRLTSWTDPGSAVVSYDWDAAGNRTAAGSDPFTYDQRNRMLTGAGETYTWTARGTLASRTAGAGSVTYSFDALGRQTEAGSVDYAYDSLDRLATRTTSSGVTTLAYAGLAPDPSTNGDLSYARSPSGLLLAAREGAGTASLASMNRHGDLAGLLGATGSLVASHVYEPFGDVVGSSGTADIGLGFQGDVTDPDTGDVWMGARWYDTAAAQFTARDTILGQLARPVTLNRYTYANGNPLLFFDPTGREGKLTYSNADIAAETDPEIRNVMLLTYQREFAAQSIATFQKNMAEAFEFVTGFSDILGCSKGNRGSCAMIAIALVPGGKAALAGKAVVRARKSAKSVHRVNTALDRIRTSFKAHLPTRRTANVVDGAHDSSRKAVPMSPTGTRSVKSPDNGPQARGVPSTPTGRSAPPPRVDPNAPSAASSPPRASFIADAHGTVIPTSRARLEGGFQAAGFPSAPTASPGVLYALPDGMGVRIMEPSGAAPLRASFTNSNGGPIDPFTRRPVQPPPGLTKSERLDYVRARTHVELGP